MSKIHKPFSSNYRVYATVFDENGSVVKEVDITKKVNLETIVRERSLIKVRFVR